MKRLLVLLALPACLSVPDEKQPECKVTSDCDTANGEVCEAGTCWGNPPPGPFAAVLSPPSERNDELVGREFEILEIPSDGYLFGVTLDEPVVYAGAIRAICPTPSTECTDVALGATIIVTRPSSFAGGPNYRQVAETDPRTGMFSLKLQRTRPDDPPYTVTVFPDGRGLEPTEIRTAQLVPPLRTELRVSENVNGKSFDLGSFTPRTIEGKIVNVNDVGQAQYRVVALGRWDANSPITEVSTVAYTTQTGAFELRLSEGLPEGSVVELEARPYGETAPTLRLNVTLNALAITGRQLTAPTVGAVAKVPITVRGTESNGEVVGIVGARVTVRGAIPSAQPGASIATYEVEGITGTNGVVELDLVGGTALQQSYRISVVPPAGAPVGVLFDRPFDGDPVVRLPNRIALAGKVRDAAGLPIEGVQVTVRPSLRFQWSFTTAPQAFVAAIPAATDVTGASGEYVVFVDPFLADGETDVWGYYDVSYDQTEFTPAWTEFDLEIPRDTTVSTLTIPELTLPDAAHIHGSITDSSGAIVEGAELKLFRTTTVGTALCMAVPHAPETCPVPAVLLGRGASNGDGEFRLSLPR